MALPTLRGCIYRALRMSHLASCPLFVHQIYRSPTLGGGGSLIYDSRPPPPPPTSFHPSGFCRYTILPSARRLASIQPLSPECPAFGSCFCYSFSKHTCSGEASSEAGGHDLRGAPMAAVISEVFFRSCVRWRKVSGSGQEGQL